MNLALSFSLESLKLYHPTLFLSKHLNLLNHEFENFSDPGGSRRGSVNHHIFPFSQLEISQDFPYKGI